MDLARSVQEVTELCMLRMVRQVHKETGGENLCLAGGVALNCVGNGRILRKDPSRIFGFSPLPETPEAHSELLFRSGINIWGTRSVKSTLPL